MVADLLHRGCRHGADRIGIRRDRRHRRKNQVSDRKSGGYPPVDDR
jgi:hypothetical protein